MYKIQKNIAIPPRTASRTAYKYPFADMEVGDSFKVPTNKAKKAQSLAYLYGRKNKQKFSARKVKDGTRIWRTK